MLFGHQNDDTNQTTQDSANPLAVDPDTGVSLPTVPEELAAEPLETPVAEPHGSSAPEPISAPAAATVPAVSNPTPLLPSDDAVVTDDTSAPADEDLLQPEEDGDLLSLKQQALEQLSPLVGHLDQTPEEKFRTTMMLIQSSDNQALIKDAYEAAQAIEDDKVRAQALLDIVNEINYFTHQQDS